ncbi:hypothetical protein [Gluconobacter aidae]|uniref:Uncharacterized protein n=1 Tax=Gluconobacter aidae TaxID=2662454 RepID=A0A7X1VMB7_9PROT|nr:hypothetical protein [Gluconobacter aidae]MQR98503.1 hypothetical protein [Gluconobacter aidae]
MPQFRRPVHSGILFCVAPNTDEVFVNLTNSQWHLAVLAFLIIVSDPPQTRAGQVFDHVFLLISALSGPFCLLLLPIAAARTIIHREPTYYTRLAIVACGVAIQAVPIIQSSGSSRPNTPLGASFGALICLLAAQLFLAPLISHNHLEYLYSTRIWQNPVFPCLVDLAAGMICFQAVRRWIALRYALVFVMLILAAPLTHPIVTTTMPQWHAMFIPDAGMRYFFMPILFWLAALVAVTFSGHGLTRALATGALLVVVVLGIPHDRKIAMEADRGFSEAARRFDAGPPGTTVTIPVRPGSTVTLTR